MANPLDNIEDSLHKAFEGFEMPVSDTDWEKIATGIQNAKKPKGGFWYTNNWLQIIGATVAILAITLAGLYFYKHNQTNSNVESTPVVKQETKQNQKEVPNLANSQNTDIKIGDTKSTLPEPTTKKKLITPNGGKLTNSTTPEPKVPQRTKLPKNNISPNPTIKDINPIVPNPVIKAPSIPEPVKVTPNNNPNPQPVINTPALPTEVSKTPTFRTDFIQAFGMRNITSVTAIAQAKGFNPFPLLHSKLIGMEWYAGIQLSMTPGTVSARQGNEIWKGVSSISMYNRHLDLRLEAGAFMRFGNWKVGVGAAFESAATTSHGYDTIRIKVADRFLPYNNTAGKTLYWLAISWRDSTVIIRRSQQRSWIEVPISIQRSINFIGKVKITAGLSLNPGYLTGSSGQTANPYVYQSGSYWQYNNNIQADTTNATSNVSDWLNHYRLGSGAMLGVEKELGAMSFGVQLNVRYYYTNAWKKGVPLKENTMNYGVNFRVGLKF